MSDGCDYRDGVYSPVVSIVPCEGRIGKDGMERDWSMYLILYFQHRAILLPVRVYFAIDVTALLDKHYGAWEREEVAE